MIKNVETFVTIIYNKKFKKWMDYITKCRMLGNFNKHFEKSDNWKKQIKDVWLCFY